jgi:hypothetical protein
MGTVKEKGHEALINIAEEQIQKILSDLETATGREVWIVDIGTTPSRRLSAYITLDDDND